MIATETFTKAVRNGKLLQIFNLRESVSSVAVVHLLLKTGMRIYFSKINFVKVCI